jgi:hypothetical protein
MAKLTLQQRYAEALVREGWTALAPKSRKYIAVRKDSGDGEVFIYLGVSGSVRIGRNRTTCVPLSDARKARLLAMVPAEKPKAEELSPGDFA